MTIASSDVERVFRESGALREGHFILASGRHSSLYLEKFQVLQHPADTERLCGAIAAWARPLGVESVAGPTTGGIILAHEVARQLGVRAIYAERRDGAPGREFRRGFALAPGERVLVVSHGGSLRALRRHCTGEPVHPIANCSVYELRFEDGAFATVD